MFGAFGLGAQEIMLLLLIGVILIGIPVGIVLLVLFMARRNRGPDDETRRPNTSHE